MVRIRVRVREVVMMIRVMVSLQEINVTLCNVPRSDHSLIMCVHGCVSVGR